MVAFYDHAGGGDPLYVHTITTYKQRGKCVAGDGRSAPRPIPWRVERRGAGEAPRCLCDHGNCRRFDCQGMKLRFSGKGLAMGVSKNRLGSGWIVSSPSESKNATICS